MSTQGPNAPGTAVDSSDTGTLAWQNPDNIKVSDNIYSTVTAGSDTTSHYLKAMNFGFSIPSVATIQAITVNIERKSSNNTVGNRAADSSVLAIKGDGSLGTTNFRHVESFPGGWPTGEVSQSYANGLWNETWAPSDINSSNFGVALSVSMFAATASVTASVDFVSIAVDYSLPSSTPLVTGRALRGVGI